MSIKFLIICTAVGIFLFSNSLFAQSFGFGCLGFVGGFGGYSYQVYHPTGLNSYVDAFNKNHGDSLSAPMSSFGKARGYRAGINFFRANLTGLILTVKGFYQQLNEKNNTSINFANSQKGSTTYEMELKSWGAGVDIGTIITDEFSWKVIDAALLFNSVKFTHTDNFPGAVTNVQVYSTPNTVLGYSIGTGFIYEIIDEYITIEGTVAFSVLSVKNLEKGDGTKLTVGENSNTVMNNFIESAGLNTVIQLNIGFPF